MRDIRFILCCLAMTCGVARGESLLDQAWHPIEDKAKASFYLKTPIEETAPGRFRFEPYYLGSDVMQFSGTLNGAEPGMGETYPVGAYRFFAKDGTLIEAGRFNASGERQGLVKIYDGDGKLKCDCLFEAGQRSGPQKEYYPNGQLKREWMMRGDEPVGQEKYYHKGGRLWSIICHTGDCSDRFYDQQGQLRMETPKRDGRKHGVETHWEAGKVEMTQAYRHGKEDGDAFAYWASGEVKQHTRWQAGIKVGEQLRYFENGQLERREVNNAQGQELSSSEFRRNGDRYRESEFTYQDGVKNRVIKRFYQKNRLVKQIEEDRGQDWRLVCEYAQGILIGREETLLGERTGRYVTASIRHRGSNREKLRWILQEHYQSGLRHGSQEKRSGDDKLLSRGEFKLGKRVGTWLTHTEEMSTTSHYDAEGRLHGEYLSLGEAGQVLERYQYDKGQLTGRFERFYADGRIFEQGQYRNDLRDGEWLLPPGDRQYSPRPTSRYEYWCGAYRLGKQVGVWRRFTDEGYLMAIARYDHQGRLHGRQYEFYPDGALQQRLEYRQGQLLKEASHTWDYQSQHQRIFMR